MVKRVYDRLFLGLASFFILLSSAVLPNHAPNYTQAQDNPVTPLDNSNIRLIQAGSIAPDDQPASSILADIYKKAHKSVVEIFSIYPNQGTGGMGTGFVFGEHIVTNAHVVLHNGEIGTVDVTFSNGNTYEAKVLGTDTLVDLAVLDLPEEADSELVSLPIGDSSTLEIGDRVLAIGSPSGFTSSMSTGIVSALGRLSSQLREAGAAALELKLDPILSANPDMIQTDTAINHGNSGGPLLNMRGEVIGVCDLGLASADFEGLNFVIPSSTVKKVIPSLISNGSFDHPWLGIAGTSVTAGIARELRMSEPRGFLVAAVADGSPAQKAGIQGGDTTAVIRGYKVTMGGDVIVSIDNKPVRNVNDVLVHLLRNKIVGETVLLTILRDGQTREVNVLLEALPQNLKPPL